MDLFAKKQTPPPSALRRESKSPTAYRTISEAAKEVGVESHVLRFWETKFSQVKPLTRAGGRRYYTVDDIALLRRIQTLLHNEGYTIKGVQTLFENEKKNKHATTVSKEELISELKAIKEILTI